MTKTISIELSDEEAQAFEAMSVRRGLSEKALLKQAIRLHHRVCIAIDNDELIAIGDPFPPKSWQGQEAIQKLAEFADRAGFPEAVLALQKQLLSQSRLASISSWPIKGRRNKTRCGDYLFFTTDSQYEIFCEKNSQPWLVFSQGVSAISALMSEAGKKDGGFLLQEERGQDGSYYMEYSHSYVDDLNLHYQPDTPDDKFKIFSSNVSHDLNGDQIVSEFVDWRWSGLGNNNTDFASPEQALKDLREYMESDDD